MSIKTIQSRHINILKVTSEQRIRAFFSPCPPSRRKLNQNMKKEQSIITGLSK